MSESGVSFWNLVLFCFSLILLDIFIKFLMCMRFGQGVVMWLFNSSNWALPEGFSRGLPESLAKPQGLTRRATGQL